MVASRTASVCSDGDVLASVVPPGAAGSVAAMFILGRLHTSTELLAKLRFLYRSGGGLSK